MHTHTKQLFLLICDDFPTGPSNITTSRPSKLGRLRFSKIFRACTCRVSLPRCRPFLNYFSCPFIPAYSSVCLVIDSSFVLSFLSFNDLREWKADPENELQWLNYLDVTGNEHLRPSEQLLKLKRLEKVEGVTWTQYCKNCSLVNIETVDAEANSTPWCYEELHSPHGWYWYDGIKYGKALAFIKLGFWPTCLCDTPCYEHQLELPYMKAVVYINAKVSYILYVTCPAGLLVNIAVVLVILRNPSLRRDLAVCLVANIAVCDAFIVLACLIYSIYLTDWKFVDHYTEMLSPEALEEDFDNGIMDFDSKTMRLRNIIGPILTFAVASEVLGSLILTFEKFLKIVYAMRPSLRITKRGAQVYLFISGICCAVFAVLPAFEVGRMSYNILIDVMPVPSDFRTGECDRMPEIRTAAAVQIALLIIQLVSLLLYLPIFLVARKSGANVGIKRETTIARKIALLVFTNLFFFVIPMILGIFACAIVNVYGAYIEENWQEYALESYHWYLASQETLPILCVTINAILNPFIVAVRHPKIKQKIGVITARCSTAVNRFLGFLRQSVHRCHNSDKTEQENNNIEMLHTDETWIARLSHIIMKSTVT